MNGIFPVKRVQSDIMSSHNSVIAPSVQEIAEGAVRSLQGELGADFLRKQEGVNDPTQVARSMSIAGLEQQVLDYYYRSLTETHKHQKVSGFVKCAEHFEMVYRGRLDFNIATLNKRVADDKTLAVAILPCCFMVKRVPSDKQKEEWQGRWNEDGDLYRAFKRKCPNGLVMPYIHHGQATNAPVMLSVLMLLAPPSVVASYKAEGGDMD